MFSSSRWLPSRRVRVVIAVELALIGLVLIWAALAGPSSSDATLAGAPHQHSVPTPSAGNATPQRPAAQTDRTQVRDQISGLVLPESHPVSVSIPSIGVRSKLVDLGLDADGALEVPKDPALAGWFSRGAAPGALGPAVIAGHVTWDGAPAVFRRLGTLQRGDQVAVTRKDGKTAIFTVSRVARFSKSHFPTHAVYGAIDHAGLRLITCGGTYDAASHRYLDNVVVFARLESVRERRG